MLFFIIEILIVGGIIAIDLTTKWAATNFLFAQPFHQADLIKGFIDLKYTENTGASWGIFQDKTLVLTIFTGIALGILLIVLIVRAKRDRKLLRIPLLLIFAGGVGNLIDRICFGYVRDFLRFTFIDFPIFNLADSSITIGAALLILALIIEIINDGKKAKAELVGISDNAIGIKKSLESNDENILDNDNKIQSDIKSDVESGKESENDITSEKVQDNASERKIKVED